MTKRPDPKNELSSWMQLRRDWWIHSIIDHHPRTTNRLPPTQNNHESKWQNKPQWTTRRTTSRPWLFHRYTDTQTNSNTHPWSSTSNIKHTCQQVTDLEDQDQDICWIRMQKNNSALHIGVYYDKEEQAPEEQIKKNFIQAKPKQKRENNGRLPEKPRTPTNIP